MRLVDCVVFWELEALRPPDAAALPEAEALAPALVSSVLEASTSDILGLKEGVDGGVCIQFSGGRF